MENKIKTETHNVSSAKSKPSLSSKATQGLKSAIHTAAQQLENTGDSGLQTVALGIKTAAIGAGTLKLTGKMSENIVNGAIKTGSFVVKGAEKIKTGVTNTYAAVVKQGILNGTRPHVQIPSMLFKALKNAPVAGVKLIGRGALAAGKFVGKGALKTGKVIIKSAAYGVKTAYNSAENALASSDNLALQGIGTASKATRYTIKTAAYATKSSLKAVKTASIKMKKAEKNAAHAIQRIQKYGLKDTVKYARNKALKSIRNAAKNLGKAAIQFMQGLTKKALIPVLVIVFAVISITGVLGNVISAAGSLFSGEFTESDTGKDVEMHSFLLEAIEKRKEKMVDEIIKIRAEALKPPDAVDIVRLMTPKRTIDLNFGEDSSDYEAQKQALTMQILEDILPTETLIEYFQPIFQCLIAAVYDSDPSSKDAKKLFEEIWTTIISLRQETTSETVCGEECCTEYIVREIHIEVGDFEKLLNKYFFDELNVLKAKGTNRTKKENERFVELTDNLELCNDYIDEFNQNIAEGNYKIN
ncbi:MAG: hypothetical protein RR540_00160 [Oscillospiraceae bacterium]